MHKNHKDPQELDLTTPRLASYEQKWKRHQDTVYWVDIQLAQRKVLKFYQTRCNAIIFYDTIPAYCISKVVVMKSAGIIYQNVYASPRPPPKITCKDNWMKELIGFWCCKKQQRHPTNPTKTQNPIIKNGETRRWARVHKGNRERYLVWL